MKTFRKKMKSAYKYLQKNLIVDKRKTKNINKKNYQEITNN